MNDYARLDGNSAAGLLTEVFAADITAETGVCGNCGASERVGAFHVYSGGPGMVFRCPSCGGVLMRITRIRSSLRVELSGLRALVLASE